MTNLNGGMSSLSRNLNPELLAWRGKMQRPRMTRSRNQKAAFVLLLAWLPLSAVFVGPTSARALRLDTKGTTDRYQDVWSVGETVQVRLKFSSAADLANFTGYQAAYINYMGLATEGNSSWSIARILAPNNTNLTVVAVFTASQPIVGAAFIIPTDHVYDPPQKHGKHGTGNGTVVYTDANKANHQVSNTLFLEKL
jgi:hypothetical protein